MTDFEPKQKEDFAAVYDLPDPRPYYRGLTATHYRMPEVMAGVVERITERLLAHRAGDDRALQVLDFACGFGAVGALLRHSLSMSSLYAHYADDPSDGLEAREVDRAFYNQYKRTTRPIILTGVDIAPSAVGYAQALGLVDTGFGVDLTQTVTPEVELSLSNTDLVVESGCIAGVLGDAFRTIHSIARNPWFIYCPRPDTDWSALEALWPSIDYVVESLSNQTVAYRRPLGRHEEQSVLQGAAEFGRPFEQAINNGYIRVPIMLARSHEDARAVPQAALARSVQDLFAEPIETGEFQQ